jgi:hypothetical protein
MTESHRRALVIAFFLSKFDRKGVKALGFKTISEAFSSIAGQLGVPVATVKQMRDQFDPYCSRVRVGYHKRKSPRSRLQIISAYDDFSELAMLEIVNGVLYGTDKQINYAIQPIEIEPEGDEIVQGDDNPFALRFRTGFAAEEYFLKNFNKFAEFDGRRLEDTRQIGSGFDFRLVNQSGYLAVEVKGIIEKSGYVSFTDREWSVANYLGEKYFLAVVRRVLVAPSVEIIRNPAKNVLVEMRQTRSVSINWTGRV